jgi:hypothetical protein
MEELHLISNRYIYLIPLIGYTCSISIHPTPPLPMSILNSLKVINANQHEIAMNSPAIWRTLLWTTFVIYKYLSKTDGEVKIIDIRIV